MMLRFISLLFVLSTTTVAQSFDCAKAATVIEKAICSSATLKRLDSEMARVYRAEKAALSAQAQEFMTTDQKAWLQRRNRQCASGNVDSLAALYKKRIEVLTGINPFRYNGTYYNSHSIGVYNPDSDTYEPMAVDDEFVFKWITADAVEFSTHTSSTNGHECSVHGTAKKNTLGAYQWRKKNEYNEGYCGVEIRIDNADGTLQLTIMNDTDCSDFCGMRASPYDIAFPLASKHSDATELWMGN